MITKEKISSMRKDIEEALRVVSEKHNCTISQGNARYDAKSFSMKLSVVANASDGSVVTKDVPSFSIVKGVPAKITGEVPDYERTGD